MLHKINLMFVLDSKNKRKIYFHFERYFDTFQYEKNTIEFLLCFGKNITNFGFINSYGNAVFRLLSAFALTKYRYYFTYIHGSNRVLIQNHCEL